MHIRIGRIGWLGKALYLLAHISVAQEITIEAGKTLISLDEPFTLNLTIKSTSSNNVYSPFPEYPHLHKRDVSSAASTSLVNGKTLITQVISQNYLATQEGEMILPASSITINNEVIPIKEIILQVGPPKDPAYREKNSLYEELLEIERKKNEPVQVKADAFFSLTTDKEEVYTGEGFTVMLALYVAENNKAELNSYKTDEQLISLMQKIRPANCWEENFNIAEFQETSVVINNKRYTRYTIYQTVFYPLNTNPIVFPRVGLKMIKYTTIPNVGSGEVTRKTEYETFYTSVKSVVVKPLPPHPLKEQVAVGTFRLKEAISNRELTTGQSFNYHFTVTGEGNFSTVHFTPSVSDTYFDFFPPKVLEDIKRANGKITGSKSFQYQILPKESGIYVMRKYFEWIFFNTKTEKYDTLSSAITVQVRGESRKNADISLNKLGPLYRNMLQESSRLVDTHAQDWIQLFANIFILLMLLVAVGLFFVRRY